MHQYGLHKIASPVSLAFLFMLFTRTWPVRPHTHLRQLKNWRYFWSVAHLRDAPNQSSFGPCRPSLGGRLMLSCNHGTPLLLVETTHMVLFSGGGILPWWYSSRVSSWMVFISLAWFSRLNVWPVCYWSLGVVWWSQSPSLCLSSVD